MKKSELFDIIIKVFGLYFLMVVLTDVKTLLLLFTTAGINSMGGNFSMFSFVFPYALNFGIDIFFAWAFLLRTKRIANYVLPRGQENEINLPIDKKTLLQISVIVVGGLMLVGAIESIGGQLIGIYQSMQMNFAPRVNPVPELIWQCVIGIMGYAVITASCAIAKYFVREKEVRMPQITDGLVNSEPFRKIPKTGGTKRNARRPRRPIKKS